MHAIAKELKRRRFEAGSLALDQAEICFALDSEGEPTHCFNYPIKVSKHQLTSKLTIVFFFYYRTATR